MRTLNEGEKLSPISLSNFIILQRPAASESVCGHDEWSKMQSRNKSQKITPLWRHTVAGGCYMAKSLFPNAHSFRTRWKRCFCKCICQQNAGRYIQPSFQPTLLSSLERRNIMPAVTLHCRLYSQLHIQLFLSCSSDNSYNGFHFPICPLGVSLNFIFTNKIKDELAKDLCLNVIGREQIQ